LYWTDVLGKGIINDIPTSMLKYLCDNLEYFKYFFREDREVFIFVCEIVV